MHVTLIEGIGYASAALGIIMIAMQTMIPLRVTGIAHNLGQIAFGLLAGIYPTVVQHVILLPINSFRLFEMKRLIRQVEAASTGDYSLEWLKPFTTQRKVKAGQVVFQKGDDADRMFFVLSGRFHVEEIDVDVVQGAVVGELAMLTPERRRTQTIICAEDAEILDISYDRIEQIYYQNPAFGFYFLKLSSARLFENIRRLELQLADARSEVRKLRQASKDTAA